MIYLWNSSATSVTGPVVQEKLSELLDTEVKITREKPEAKAGDVVICYGAKTSREVSFDDGITVINHPNSIRTNRNKLSALKKMDEANTPVAEFIELEGASRAQIRDFVGGKMVVCRTKYHQGGRGFFLTNTVDGVIQAREAGAGYAQKLLPIAREYRLHVTGDEVIAASKKVLRDNPDEAWKNDYRDMLAKRVEKGGDDPNDIDWDLVNKVLNMVAKDLTFPDLVVRSHKRGWKFKRINNINQLNQSLKDAAIAAVKALGLDFAAVDCAILEDGTATVIEVNTGPALQGKLVDKFCNSIIEYANLGQANKELENNIGEAINKEEPVQAVAADDADEKGKLIEVINRLQKQNEELMELVKQMAG